MEGVKMNSLWFQIFSGMFRTILATVSGYAIAKGTISADQATQITGVLGALGTAGLSAASKALNARQ